MLEMAAVSFNRVRLEYYANKKIKRAIWLQHLLQKPSRLFGTVMLGVNIALQLGSQSAREFYQALGLNPDIAAISQIFFVVIVAELAPLFAAYRYAEHVIMLGVPIVYATSIIFTPIIEIIGFVNRGLVRLFGSQEDNYDPFLSREELQKILESHEEESQEGNEFNLVVSNIFSLKNKRAGQVMTPLGELPMIPSNATVAHMRQKISLSSAPFVLVNQKTSSNIVAIAVPRDLVRLGDNKIVRDFSRPPWFITTDTPLIHILKQFRRNNQSVAVVLDANGFAKGVLTLESIFEEIFGEFPALKPFKARTTLIERTFPGNTKVSDINVMFDITIPAQEGETLAQLMITNLERVPEEGESIIIGQFELVAEETTLLGIKSIIVKTLE